MASPAFILALELVERISTHSAHPFKKLATLRLFMVGCGAIGCEMLKNFR